MISYNSVSNLGSLSILATFASHFLQITFSGAGTTLSGRAPRPRTPPPVKEEEDDIQMMGQTLGGGGGGGGGRTLGNSGGGSTGALKRKKTGGKSLNERDVEMEEVIELD